MSASFNQVQLIGNLGDTPHVQYTKSNTPKVILSVATHERWMDDNGQKHERTNWSRIVVFGKQALNCAEYLQKGSSVHIVGKLQTRIYKDDQDVTRYITEVIANNVNFLGSAPKNTLNDSSTNEPPAFTDEDIPF